MVLVPCARNRPAQSTPGISNLLPFTPPLSLLLGTRDRYASFVMAVGVFKGVAQMIRWVWGRQNMQLTLLVGHYNSPKKRAFIRQGWYTPAHAWSLYIWRGGGTAIFGSAERGARERNDAPRSVNDPMASKHHPLRTHYDGERRGLLIPAHLIRAMLFTYIYIPAFPLAALVEPPATCSSYATPLRPA